MPANTIPSYLLALPDLVPASLEALLYNIFIRHAAVTVALAAAEFAVRPFNIPSIPFQGPVSPSILEQRIQELIARLQNALPHHVRAAGPQNAWEEGETAKCASSCGGEIYWDKDMQRQSAPGPSSNTTQGNPRDSSRNIGEQASRENPQELERVSQVSGEQVGTSRNLEHKPSRPLDVHRILNPTLPGEPGTVSRRRDAQHLESPPSSIATQFSSLSRSPNVEFASPGGYSTPQSAGGYSGSIRGDGRVILTPRSPALRSASMGRPSITGIMSAVHTPFLTGNTGRGYPTGTGSSGGPELPPVPTPPAVHPSHLGHSYGFPQTAPTPVSSRRVSMAGHSMPQSQAASPSTSYSSFSQPSQTSPAAPFRPLAAQEHPQSYQNAPQYGAPVVHQQGGRSAGSPLEGRFQHGPGVSYYPQIEIGGIDLENGSRAADEKRKRNAGASARFRARRKEREREASHTIQKLEQERDFYRSERDYFRGIVYSMPNHQQLLPRPLSPRLRPNTQLPESDVSASGSSPWPESQAGDSTGRRTRRRTSTLPSTYHLPQLPETKVTLAGSPTGYTLVLPAADQRMDPRSLSGTDSTSVPRSAPYDPFHPGPFGGTRMPGR